MKQQKTRRARFFTLAAIVVVLMSNVYVGRAEVITPKIKWEMSGNLNAISKPGRVLSTGTALVDLTNGKVLYRVKQDSGEVLIHLSYFGDRFYVQTSGKGGWYNKEYETKTVQYLGDGRTKSNSPNELYTYSTRNRSIIFHNIKTGELIDSVFLLNAEFYYTYVDYSPDNRYFIENANYNNNYYLFLYDFTTKEMIIKGQLNTPYCFFNKSNKLALGEYIKLDGDDKKYGYIRIYDPDQRKYIKDIKVGEYPLTRLIIKNEDDLLFYKVNDDIGMTKIFDLKTFKSLEIELMISPLCYVDDSLMISSPLYSYEMDWSLVGVDDIKTVDDTIIYPNPTNNQITIDNIITAGKTYKMTNITGIQLPILDKMQITDNSISIDMTSLISGIYYLNISDKTSSKTYKILKI